MADSSEELIAKAVSFLSSATGRSTQEKEQFLLEKGLTQEQIQEAYRRMDDSKGRPGSQGMPPGPQPPIGPTGPTGPTAPAAPVRPTPPTPPRPVTPVTPSYPSTSPGYQAPPYPGSYQASPYAPPPPPMPPMMYPGYPLPLEPPSTGGPWWAWLLGGLGAGLVGTYLANPFRLRPEDGLDPRELFTDAEKPKQESQGDIAKQSDTGGEPDTKASYEELLSLLRQQSEEAKANVSMCAKTLQQTQEQHQKMFAEMQKALQNTQQKSSKPQTMELSASTIQALATMIQNAWSGGEPENGNAPSLPSVTSGPALAKGSPSGATPSPAPLPSAAVEGSAASAQSLRESFDATNASLQRVVTESNTKQEATKSLNTVAMILSNFLKDPSSDRNRKVNTSGSRFSEIFRNNSAAGELLKLAGFQYQHPNFVFNETGQINAEGAQRTLDLVQEAQRNIDQTWSTRGDRPAAAPAAPAAAPAAAPVAPAPAPAAAPTPSASSSAEAARPWAPRQPPPGAPQAWVNMTRDINEDPQPPVQAQAQPAQAGPTPAHPAETLPPAIAHPAESEARPMAQAAAQPATQPATQPPQQPSHVAPSQPQHHLPIAHPAEAAPVGEVPSAPPEVEEVEESQPQSGG